MSNVYRVFHHDKTVTDIMADGIDVDEAGTVTFLAHHENDDEVVAVYSGMGYMAVLKLVDPSHGKPINVITEH